MTSTVTRGPLPRDRGPRSPHASQDRNTRRGHDLKAARHTRRPWEGAAHCSQPTTRMCRASMLMIRACPLVTTRSRPAARLSSQAIDFPGQEIDAYLEERDGIEFF